MKFTRRFLLLAFVCWSSVGCAISKVHTTQPSTSTKQTQTEDIIDPVTGKVTGRKTTTQEASAAGMGGDAEGDKASQSVQSGGAESSIGPNGPVAKTEGGGAKGAASMDSSTQFWGCLLVGVLFIIGAAAAQYFQLNRAPVILLGIGVFFITIAIWPQILIYGLILVVIFGGVYLYVEKKGLHLFEAVRATTPVLAAHPEAKEMLFNTTADPKTKDAATIRAVALKDGITL